MQETFSYPGVNSHFNDFMSAYKKLKCRGLGVRPCKRELYEARCSFAQSK